MTTYNYNNPRCMETVWTHMMYEHEAAWSQTFTDSLGSYEEDQDKLSFLVEVRSEAISTAYYLYNYNKGEVFSIITATTKHQKLIGANESDVYNWIDLFMHRGNGLHIFENNGMQYDLLRLVACYVLCTRLNDLNIAFESFVTNLDFDWYEQQITTNLFKITLDYKKVLINHYTPLLTNLVKHDDEMVIKAFEEMEYPEKYTPSWIKNLIAEAKTWITFRHENHHLTHYYKLINDEQEFLMIKVVSTAKEEALVFHFYDEPEFKDFRLKIWIGDKHLDLKEIRDAREYFEENGACPTMREILTENKYLEGLQMQLLMKY